MAGRDAAREAYFERTRETLEQAYLRAKDPRAQSGFHGDEARWERLRRPIVEAMDRDGTFLDVGCANGHLMECVARWAREKGLTIEPYGVDLSAPLVALARRRLPAWRDRFFVANAWDWEPPRRFTFVGTELVYVPEEDRRQYVSRLTRDVVEGGGRLIVTAYGSRSRGEPPEDPERLLAAWGYRVAGTAEGRDEDGVLLTRVAWMDAPG